MSFNYQNAYIGLITDTPAAIFAAGECAPAAIKLIGITSSESTYTLNPEQQQRSSYGENYVLTWKLDISLPVLTKLTSQQRGQIDGKRGCVVIIPSDGIDLDANVPDAVENADQAVLDAISGMVILAPCRLWITEDEQFGTGEVQPITITGEQIAETKDDLRKPLEFVAPD